MPSGTGRIAGKPPRRLAAAIGMLRPLVGAQAMVYVLLGAYLGSSVGDLGSQRVWVAALVVGLVVSCGYVVNDYCDVVVDRLSRPERAIPAGHISRREAGLLAVGLSGAALTLALALGPGLAAFALATLGLSAAYSYTLKSTVLLGNLSIAVLDASIIMYGSLATGHLPHAVLVAAVLILLYITAQEILYTIEDHDGDRQAGLRTIATAWGTTASLRAFQGILLTFGVAALLPPLVHLAPVRYLYGILPCSLLPTAGIAFLVSRDPTPGTIKRATGLMKLVWLVSTIPILLLK
jgi:geranylgeranylglycerol-phosphate geranylgeranyltransferase